MRPVLSAYTVSAGGARVAETYLSPLHYSGWRVGLGYERMQAMRFDPDAWVMRLHGDISTERTLNPAGSAVMWGLDIDMGWGMMRRWRFGCGWSVYAGGATALTAGALYKPANSNNPVAAKAAWTIGPLVQLTYNGHMGRLPFCARYIAGMPLTGVFFGPQYGELYYEIYLGNHSHLAHGAWPGNYFRLDNTAGIDLRFGATILRLGYRCAVLSSEASGIVTFRVSHMAVVGVASEWVSLSARGDSRLNKARIISAMY